jgi:hypothetical protein
VALTALSQLKWSKFVLANGMGTWGQESPYVLTDAVGDSFRRVNNVAGDLLGHVNFPLLEGSRIALATGEETPRHEEAYALTETKGYGFHRITLPNVVMISEKVNAIDLNVHVGVRSRLRVELLGQDPSDYGRADFNLNSGDIEQSHKVVAAYMSPLTGGWFHISLSMRLMASRGVVTLALLNSNNAVNYRGTPGAGLMICVPRLQAK